jgi:uncharacterized protein (DUF302 family)
VSLLSEYSFAETVERLESKVTSLELTIFARIDFSDVAARACLKMKPTRLLIFGNPKAGTPLMLASPTLALDFPLKILVAEDEDGKTWVSYNSLQYLKERHSIPDNLLQNIAGIVSIVESTVT